MSPELLEVRQEIGTRRTEALVKALDYELAGSIEAAGGILLGFSVKLEVWDCLITLRAVHGGNHKVCFVGSDNLINCFLKAVNDAQNDLLRWKPDRYHSSEA